MAEPKRNDPAEWNQIAAAYEEINEPFMGPWADKALEIAGVQPAETVLDVATGTGVLAVRAAALGARVVATDFADGMLERLRQKIQRDAIANVDVKRMDGQRLEFGDAQFDVAFSLFGLMFFPDRIQGFRELCRVLKPGGRAVVVGWGPLERMPVFAGMMKGIREAQPDLPSLPPGKSPFESLANPADFASEMVRAGFDNVTLTTHTIEQEFPGTAEEFFEQQSRANVFVAGLKEKLSPADFAKVTEKACEGIRAAVGPSPFKVSGEANFGFGLRGDDDDDE